MLAFLCENWAFVNQNSKTCWQIIKKRQKSQQGGIIMGLTVEYLEKMLSELSERKENINIELAKCPVGNLGKVRRGEKDTYMQYVKVDGRRKRWGITKKPDTIEALARKAILQKEIVIINRDIKAIGDMMKVYIEPTFENIIRGMPDYIVSNIYIMKDDNVWEQDYEQSTYKPEDRRFTTSKGLKVRSKSELLISEKLKEFGLNFRYEPILKLGEYDLVPDFEIKRKSSSDLIYWEHCGMTNNEKYMKHHKWKMELYEQNGIVPWKNLIVTYDDGDGLIDMRVVTSEIKNKLL